MRSTLLSANKNEIQLNSDQQKLAKEINEWKQIQQPGSFLLNAHAGTGKTATISQILQNDKIFLAAPTHRAVREFRNRLSFCDSYATVHSLLSAQPVINEETGNLEFITGEGQELDQNTILVIDEGGMICKDHVYKIESIYKNIKRIYLMDSEQLPPVKEKRSELLDLKHQKKGKLTKIERYSGDILELANNILSDRFEIPDSLQSKQMSRQWKAALRDEAECKLLAYTNKCVDKWNMEARLTLFGEIAYDTDYEDGDRLILKAPLTNPESDPYDKVIYQTNEPATLWDYQNNYSIYTLNNVQYPIHCGLLHFDEIGDSLVVDLMSESLKIAMDKWKEWIINAIKNNEVEKPRSLWGRYYSVLDRFANVKHNYASTIHVSQGATIDSVFLDVGNILSCRDKGMKKALMYTALTRASNRLVCSVN